MNGIEFLFDLGMYGMGPCDSENGGKQRAICGGVSKELWLLTAACPGDSWFIITVVLCLEGEGVSFYS